MEVWKMKGPRTSHELVVHEAADKGERGGTSGAVHALRCGAAEED